MAIEYAPLDVSGVEINKRDNCKEQYDEYVG
jgi:hypothetical protein